MIPEIPKVWNPGNPGNAMVSISMECIACSRILLLCTIRICTMQCRELQALGPGIPGIHVVQGPVPSGLERSGSVRTHFGRYRDPCRMLAFDKGKFRTFRVAEPFSMQSIRRRTPEFLGMHQSGRNRHFWHFWNSRNPGNPDLPNLQNPDIQTLEITPFGPFWGVSRGSRQSRGSKAQPLVIMVVADPCNCRDSGPSKRVQNGVIQMVWNHLKGVVPILAVTVWIVA